MDNQQESSNKDLIVLPGLIGYFTNKCGELLSTRRSKIPKRMTQSNHFGRGKKPYLRVKVDGVTYLSHRLIASVIVNRPLKNGEVVNHKNGVTTDNRIINLEVVSQRENVFHAVQAKLYCQGKAWYLARGMQECRESPTTRPRSPDRTVKAQERGAPDKVMI